MPHYVWIFIFIFSISPILVQFHSLQELCFALDTMARICVDIYKQHGQHCNALQASAAMCDSIRNLHLDTLLVTLNLRDQRRKG